MSRGRPPRSLPDAPREPSTRPFPRAGELRRLLPGFAVEALAFDRHRLGGAENATLGRRAPAAFIENRADLDARHALVTFLADLELLAAADVFVGTAGTTIGRVGLGVAAARTAGRPKFDFHTGRAGGNDWEAGARAAVRVRRWSAFFFCFFCRVVL